MQKWRRVRGALHCVLVEEKGCESDYLNFMFRMFVVRRYRVGVWQRLVPAIPAVGQPSWGRVRNAFKVAYDVEDRIFPHQYRPTTLRGYFDRRHEWQCAQQLEHHVREELTLKLLYRALPRREIHDFVSAACPRTFGAMYDKLREDLGHISGVFGDYGIKLMLDMLVFLGAVPPAAISRWPVACPGYQTTLAAIFPGLPETLHLQALYWVHRQFGRTWRLQFPESCAQLCWDHRRQAGSLDDLMEHESTAASPGAARKRGRRSSVLRST